MRNKINEGEHLFVDHHLSHTAELIRAEVIEPIDFAILEAIAITEDGMLIPTTSVGNSLTFATHAKSIIIEINTAQPTQLEGIHDLYDPGKQGERKPIPLMKADDRIGTTGIPIDLESERYRLHEPVRLAVYD